MSDHRLRRLHRLWLESGGNEDAQRFMHEFTRTEILYAFDPIERALIDLLMAHNDEHGVSFHTSEATVQLLHLLLGQEAVRSYGSYLGGVENRSYLDLDDLESLLKELNLRCGHHPDCDTNDAKCDVRSCLCPGCFNTSMLARIGRRSTVKHDVCYHHWQLFSSLGEDTFFQHYDLDTI